ncbi:PAS domain-containing sensor histidine kinase [Mycobacterium sherrisii]|uniref:PAS domain-containing sensor histidine kinase n=1 Tax=Mycobacterium sherrisii TaxID=243061 RepID=UPI000A01B87C|nr:PAS domain S-box protein [Mycobacterium sherrisii]MCV7032297.1 PAS domain S-box protein [Mycobacterium sherrisii]
MVVENCSWRSGEPSSLVVEHVLAVAPQPVFVVDDAGRVLFANPAAAHGFGYQDAHEMQGRLSHQTWHHSRPDGTAYPATECPLLAAAHQGEPAHGCYEWFIRADGSMFPTTWRCAPIEIAGRLGAVFTFTDLTERHAAEEANRARDAAEIRAAESLAAQRRMLEATTVARQQIARDLHDGAQQRLINLLIQLQLTREYLPPAEDVGAQLLETAVLEAKAAINDLRELAAGIHPSILTTRGLVPAIRALAARTPVVTRVSAEIADRPAPQIEVSAYFIVAEALTNVVKHARATSASIHIAGDTESLHLTISDDGVGNATRSPGFGLVAMADRVGALGGTLRIESPSAGGTTIHVVLPWRLEPGGAIHALDSRTGRISSGS